MQDKDYIEVERVLSEFKEECRRNFYKNKENVIIKHEDGFFNSVGGLYNHEKNETEIYKEDSFIHEAFHMAFRDPDKVNQKLFDDQEIYYGNGLTCLMHKDGKTIYFHRGLTEGFAEFLSRKTNSFTKGHSISHFFTNILIAIYGIDIVEYPLNNDPIGFLSDERFHDIFTLSRHIDKIEECVSEIIIISKCRNILEDILKTNNNSLKREIFKSLGNTMKIFKLSIIEAFKGIIEEFSNCQNPLISKSEFIRMLKSFFEDEEFEPTFSFDKEEISVRESITRLIKDFENQKTITKEIPV